LGIQNGGYAASKQWGAKVLATIKKYRLYELDKHPEGVETDLALQAAPAEPKPRTSAFSVYTVKKGDTLSAIATKFRSSVRLLMSKNSLSNTRLSIGQKLLL
jgi:LysM repeat protein